MYNNGMKVGIFGGTFNPPHKTHQKIAEAAKKQLNLDELIVVPCGIPPHKRCEVDAATRLALSQSAFSSFATVSNYELNKQGKSYTVETLRHFHEVYPAAQFFLIIGGDSFAAFDKWYCPKEIASLATLAVADRDHKTFSTTAKRVTEETNARTVFLNVTPDSVSSTEIRLRYEFGLPNSDFVPKEVDEYVLENNLYSNYRPIAEKLRGYLTEERFMHTFYVVKRGLELAEEEEKDKVFLACLLHDCAKYVPQDKYAYYGFQPPADMPLPVVHSFLGEIVAKKDFGVTDSDVLSAIAYHTTGCPDMTRLQKIVYVADKTEETRPYPLAHLKKGSLDRQFKGCLLEANSYTVARHGKKIYPLTQETLNFYFPNRTN